MIKPIDAVASYLKLGWSVIPIRPRDKKPLVEWGPFQHRLPTETEIEEWRTRWPEANVGIVTGMKSGLIVLDVDGQAGQTSLVGKHLPPTIVARTGRGWHYLFKHPGYAVKTIAGLAPGLDIRGDGGYIVVPPSIHQNGKSYAWAEGMTPQDLELAEAPAWLFPAVATTTTREIRHRSPYSEILQGVTEGSRNDAAARLSGHLFQSGLPQDEVGGILLAWNLLNRPPLPDSELSRVLESIGTRDSAKQDTAPFCLPLSKLLEAPQNEPDWLIQSILEKGAIGFIGGEPKLSKSWLALHLAISLATGSRFLDHFEIAQKRRVL